MPKKLLDDHLVANSGEKESTPQKTVSLGLVVIRAKVWLLSLVVFGVLIQAITYCLENSTILLGLLILSILLTAPAWTFYIALMQSFKRYFKQEQELLDLSKLYPYRFKAHVFNQLLGSLLINLLKFALFGIFIITGTTIIGYPIKEKALFLLVENVPVLFFIAYGINLWRETEVRLTDLSKRLDKVLSNIKQSTAS